MNLIQEANMGELRPALSQLQATDITLPETTRKAITAIAVLEDESHFDSRPPADLASLSPGDLIAEMDRITYATVHFTDRRNTAGHFRQILANQIRDDLIEHTDDILDALRKPFDTAAAVVKAAHAAGLRHTHDADDAIELGPKAIEMWQKLPDACSTLDDIAQARLTLAKVTDQPPARDQQSGAFSDGSGAWNGYDTRRGNRWLLLVDRGLKLNTAEETRAACRKPPREPLAASGPDIDQATLQAMLGNPSAVMG